MRIAAPNHANSASTLPASACLAAVIGLSQACAPRPAPALVEQPHPAPAAPATKPPLLLPMVGGYVVSESCAAVDGSNRELVPDPATPPPKTSPSLVIVEEGRHCRAEGVAPLPHHLVSTTDPTDAVPCLVYQVQSTCRGDFAVLEQGQRVEVEARGPAALGAFVAGFPYQEPPPPEPLPPMPDFGTDFEARDNWILEHQGPSIPPPPAPFPLEVRGSTVEVIQGPEWVRVMTDGNVAFEAPAYADYFVAIDDSIYARLGSGQVLRLEPDPVAVVLGTCSARFPEEPDITE